MQETNVGVFSEHSVLVIYDNYVSVYLVPFLRYYHLFMN